MTSTNEASSPVVSPPLEADAHGKAALLLAESTLHALVEQGFRIKVVGVLICV